MATAQSVLDSLFRDYGIRHFFFDEMFDADPHPRPHYSRIFRELTAMSPFEIQQRQECAVRPFCYKEYFVPCTTHAG
jgi:uncharacterized circularly permuted ATP-grasp superfamily protein